MDREQLLEMLRTIRYKLDQGLDEYPLNYEQSLFLQDLLFKLEVDCATVACDKSPPATGAMEDLPPLPKPACLIIGVYGYRHADMERYAREAIAHHQRKQAGQEGRRAPAADAVVQAPAITEADVRTAQANAIQGFVDACKEVGVINNIVVRVAAQCIAAIRSGQRSDRPTAVGAAGQEGEQPIKGD